MKIGNISLIAPSHYPHEHWSEAEVLGSLMWLWQYVPSLKDAPLSYLMTRVVPYIQHKQFVVCVENGRVIGYVSWAFLNIETEKNTYKLRAYHFQLKKVTVVIAYGLLIGLAHLVIAKRLKTSLHNNYFLTML